MNNSKDLWGISTESDEMSLEEHQVPLKGLAQALRGRMTLLRLSVALQPRQWDHTATPSTRPDDAIIVRIAFNNSDQYSIT